MKQQQPVRKHKVVSCLSFMCDSVNTHIITWGGGCCCGWCDVLLGQEVFPASDQSNLHHSVRGKSPVRLTAAVPSPPVVSSHFVAAAV